MDRMSEKRLEEIGIDFPRSDLVKAEDTWRELLGEVLHYRMLEDRGELVRVVRCKDCVDNGACPMSCNNADDNAYCSNGEREG